MRRRRLHWCKASWLIVVGLGFSIRHFFIMGFYYGEVEYADVDIEAVVRCWM